MTIQKVLVPIDGSEESMKAVSLAAELAPRQGWAVIVLHVLERPPLPDFTFPPDVAARAMNELRYYGRRILDDASAILEDANIEVTSELVEGRAPETIIERVDREPCGMVILGSTGLGRGRLSSLIFGSVAEQVIRQVHVPALVVKSDPGE